MTVKRWSVGVDGPDEKGNLVKYTDYAALEEKLKQIVAENAALKKFCKNASFDADFEATLGMEIGGFTDAFNEIKTTATDAAINEIKAQGVDEFGLYHNFSDKQSIAKEAKKFAEKLRVGGAS